MKFKFIIIFFISLFLYGCNQYNLGKSSVQLKTIEKKYKNSGFTLIYANNFKEIFC